MGGGKHDPAQTAPAVLRRLVGDAERFATVSWGRAPMRHRMDRPLDDVLTLASVDAWLENAARRPAFRMVRAGGRIPDSDYTRTVRIGGANVGAVADPDKIARLFADGATLVLQNLERSMP